MVDDYTFEEAKKAITQVESVLTKYGIDPYSVYECEAKSYLCLESCPPQYVASQFYIKTDIPENKEYTNVDGMWNWEHASFMHLRCGLVDTLPTSWKERIAFWKWEEPEIWKKERIAWRESREVKLKGTEVDQMREQCDALRSLKRKYEKIEKALGKIIEDEYPKKKQRTDEEVKEDRKKEMRMLFPEDEDDI